MNVENMDWLVDERNEAIAERNRLRAELTVARRGANDAYRAGVEAAAAELTALRLLVNAGAKLRAAVEGAIAQDRAYGGADARHHPKDCPGCAMYAEAQRYDRALAEARAKGAEVAG